MYIMYLPACWMDGLRKAHSTVSHLSCELFGCSPEHMIALLTKCCFLPTQFVVLNCLWTLERMHFLQLRIIVHKYSNFFFFFPELMCKVMICSSHLLVDWVLGVQWEIAIACRKIMKLLWRISSELFNLIQNSHMRIPFVVMSMRHSLFFLSISNIWKWNSPRVLFCDLMVWPCTRYVALDDFENGIKSYQSALRLDARHYNSWFGLGMIYFRQEKFEFAEHHFRTANQINPCSSVIASNLGTALHALQVPLAISMLKLHLLKV